MKKNSILLILILSLVMVFSSAIPSFAAGYYDGSGASIPRDPNTGRDFIWFVDIGSGSFEVGGVTVTVTRNGAAVSGIVDLSYSGNIRLNSPYRLDGIRIYLAASDGSRVQLMPNGDGEVCVGLRIPEGSYVPFHVSLVLEYEVSTEPIQGKYSVDFGSGIWDINGQEVSVFVEGQPAAGTMFINASDNLQFSGLDRDLMQVRLYGDDGFAADLVLTGDDMTSLGQVSDSAAVLPLNLRFAVEPRAFSDPAEYEGSRKYSVDLGRGTWNVDGREVTVEIAGVPASGTISIGGSEEIVLRGIDQETMQVCVYGNDGFKAVLQLSGAGSVCLARREDENVVFPDELRFGVEARPREEPPEGQSPEGRQIVQVDFGSGSWSVKGSDKPVTAWMGGVQLSGTIKLEETDEIKLVNFDGGKMQARIYADDGFSNILIHSGDNEVGLGRREDESGGLPDFVHFTVEEFSEDPGGRPDDGQGGQNGGRAEDEKAFPTAAVIGIAAVVIIVIAAAVIVKKKKDRKA